MLAVPFLLAGGNPSYVAAPPSLRASAPAGVTASSHPPRVGSAVRRVLTSKGTSAQSDERLVFRIQEATARHFGLDIEQLLELPTGRPQTEAARNRTRARAVAVYLSCVDTDFAMGHIAHLFGCTQPGAIYVRRRAENSAELREIATAVRAAMLAAD